MQTEDKELVIRLDIQQYFMLRRGISINAVSKNAGVSIDTLSRTYDFTQSDDYVAEITKNDYTRFDEKREKIKT